MLSGEESCTPDIFKEVENRPPSETQELLRREVFSDLYNCFAFFIFHIVYYRLDVHRLATHIMHEATSDWAIEVIQHFVDIRKLFSRRLYRAIGFYDGF